MVGFCTISGGGADHHPTPERRPAGQERGRHPETGRTLLVRSSLGAQRHAVHCRDACRKAGDGPVCEAHPDAIRRLAGGFFPGPGFSRRPSAEESKALILQEVLAASGSVGRAVRMGLSKRQPSGRLVSPRPGLDSVDRLKGSQHYAEAIDKYPYFAFSMALLGFWTRP